MPARPGRLGHAVPPPRYAGSPGTVDPAPPAHGPLRPSAKPLTAAATCGLVAARIPCPSSRRTVAGPALSGVLPHSRRAKRFHPSVRTITQFGDPTASLQQVGRRAAVSSKVLSGEVMPMTGFEETYEQWIEG